jgi:SOS response regulatory protein OraA/RecX
MRKGVAAEIIAEALRQIDNAQNIERLHDKLSKRMRTVKYSSPYDLRNKLIRSGLSLGFSMDDVLHCVEQLTQNLNFETECDDF